MSGVTDHLVRGRAAYARSDWPACATALASANEGSALGAEDLRRLAVARFLVGDGEGSLRALARVHREALAEHDWTGAADAAFWHAWMLYVGGEHARAGGWLARACTVVEQHQVDPAVAALPSTLRARHLIETGQPEAALELAARAATTGQALGAPELHVMGLLAASMALIRLGRAPEALPRLDEVMATIEVGELAPTVAGLAYCAVIAACMSLHDIRRAAEWTAALSEWCATQSGLVPYRGQCLVHRTQIRTLEGAWAEAITEAAQACDLLTGPAVGDGWYHLGELHRLRGDEEQAEACYRRANTAGRQPDPGLALLRLAQGRSDTAVAAMRRLHDEPARLDRADVLAAYVEVMAAVGDVPAATAAARELREMADRLASDVLSGHAASAEGTAALAAGRPAEAIVCLRPALATFVDLRLPYLAARTHERLGAALELIGESDAASLERDAARAGFEALGAVPDLARLGTPAAAPGGLTAREVEVIRLVATGRSNRAVADELVLSEKTVARHLSNIYTKLGITSRAAATAFAYDHHLVR